MSKDDRHQAVRAILAALGGPDFLGLAASLETLGEDACDILLGAATGDVVGQFGARAAHGRAVHEDFNEVLCMAASYWPGRFTERVAADSRLRGDGTVVWALGWADCALSERLLIDAAGVRAAGQQYIRWAAVHSLERLGSPALPDVLTVLVKDRAEFVRGAAISAAIGYGDSRLIPALHRIARADRTPPGTRDDAWDAIAAIAVREGLTDAPIGPSAGRLIPVRRPSADAAVRVLSLERVPDPLLVHSGLLLATLEVGADRIVVTAPCLGRLVANLMIVGKPAPAVLAWIRADVY